MNTAFIQIHRGLILAAVLCAAAVGCRHTPLPDPVRDARFAPHVQALRARVPTKHFSVVVEPPFVLVGDLPARQMIRHAQRVVRPMVAQLKTSCFAQEPDHIIDIWLFRNVPSYRKYVPQLFGHAPVSHFGYMSAEHHALIVNMATGAGVGTLRHEVVHPFVAANLQDGPPWFDEGLASLYERIDDRRIDLRGIPNWRLALLQEGIRNQETLSLEDLMQLNREAFYNDTLGLHYAQSRYLCFYLQEKRLLSEFCTTFVQRQQEDPCGYDTLCDALQADTLDAFQAAWEAFVMTLSFH